MERVMRKKIRQAMEFYETIENTPRYRVNIRRYGREGAFLRDVLKYGVIGILSTAWFIWFITFLINTLGGTPISGLA